LWIRGEVEAVPERVVPEIGAVEVGTVFVHVAEHLVAGDARVGIGVGDGVVDLPGVGDVGGTVIVVFEAGLADVSAGVEVLQLADGRNGATGRRDVVKQVFEADDTGGGSADGRGRDGLVLAFADVDDTPAGGGAVAGGAEQVGRDPGVGGV